MDARALHIWTIRALDEVVRGLGRPHHFTSTYRNSTVLVMRGVRGSALMATLLMWTT